MEKNTFKNLPTKKFYDFFNEKIQNRELSHKELVDKFDIYPKNPSGFLYELSHGKSVKLEHILLAKEHFSLNPCGLFTNSKEEHAVKTLDWVNEAGNIVLNEDPAPYVNPTLAELIKAIKEQSATIKTQQETIHFLITGKGGELDRKKAS